MARWISRERIGHPAECGALKHVSKILKPRIGLERNFVPVSGMGFQPVRNTAKMAVPLGH
jgi:hypothetical protein